MNESSKDFSQPENFNINDIEEASTDSDKEDTNVVHAGNVEVWKRLSFNEKAKARPFITSIVLLLWVICTVAGVMRWVGVGDITLLAISPALIIVPVGVVLKFYYVKE